MHIASIYWLRNLVFNKNMNTSEDTKIVDYELSCLIHNTSSVKFITDSVLCIEHKSS